MLRSPPGPGLERKFSGVIAKVPSTRLLSRRIFQILIGALVVMALYSVSMYSLSVKVNVPRTRAELAARLKLKDPRRLKSSANWRASRKPKEVIEWDWDSEDPGMEQFDAIIIEKNDEKAATTSAR